MTLALHCDLASCDLWQTAQEQDDWITVAEGTELVGHFCSIDHAVRGLAAMSQPTEVFPS